MITYEPLGGEFISYAVQKMVDLASAHQDIITASFNGVPLTVTPGDSPETLVQTYHEESQRRSAAYRASPEYQQQQQEAAEARVRQRLVLEGALNVAPASLTLREPAKWEASKAAQTTEYGAAVLRYAEIWARIMEGRLAAGEHIATCAEETSHVADTEGLTGFMYSLAVALLAECWIHGEELRRWHNHKTQLRDEGDKANATGSVLNLALLWFG